MRFFWGQVLSSVPLGYVFSRMGVVIHPQPTDFQSSVFLFGKHTMTLLFFFWRRWGTLNSRAKGKHLQCDVATSIIIMNLLGR